MWWMMWSHSLWLVVAICFVKKSQSEILPQNKKLQVDTCNASFYNDSISQPAARSNDVFNLCENEVWPNIRCSHRKSCFTIQQICDGVDDCGDSTDECDSMCRQTFRCSFTGKCIALNKFCDGKADCEDGSDELGAAFQQNATFSCVNQWNSATSQNGSDFRCLLPNKYLCDGVNHCGDHSDECSVEANCNKENVFYCKNNRCISKMNVCDGKDDCEDASDECMADCTKSFRCRDGTCIAFNQFCDGIAHCKDGSDEIANDSDTFDDGFFQKSALCSNIKNYNKKQCLLPAMYLCDGTEHCLHREDECVGDCNFSYQCRNGRCIIATKICDRFDDCGDMSDECGGICRDHFFHCTDGSCLSVDRFCDGVVDCPNGEDENDNLSEDGFFCYGIKAGWRGGARRKCRLPDQFMCDGVGQCENREDECQSNCSSSFFCDNDTTCVPRKSLCNGIVDCKDLSDEPSLKGPTFYQRGFKCRFLQNQGFTECVLPQNFVGDLIADCADESDVCTDVEDDFNLFSNVSCVQCLRNRTVTISIKQLCDGVYDCPDLSDECLCEGNTSPQICSHICFESDIKKCAHPDMVPCLLPNAQQRISSPPGMQWIKTYCFCDGVKDCSNEADEVNCNINSNWSTFTTDSHGKVNDKSRLPKNKKSKYNQTISCFSFQENNFWTPEFARPCDGDPECFFMEDECDLECSIRPQFCNFRSSSGSYNCPDDQILPGKLVCDGKANCRKGKFDEESCLNRFYCHSGNTVSVEKETVCDFKNDCEDASDEMHCLKTHFYCRSRKPFYIRRQKVMDGVEDCQDGSDECPQESFGKAIFSSEEFMIKNKFLQVMVWVMGLLAVCGNLTVIINTFKVLRKLSKRQLKKIAIVYNLLIFNLAISDFLMGVFLLYLAGQNVLMSGKYCHLDRSWRTGVQCKVLGVLATVSFEVSLITLAVLSSYRLYCVIKPIPSRNLDMYKALLYIASAWVIGFCIAIIPLCKFFENYFVDFVWLRKSPYFLTDIVSKKVASNFCKTLLVYNVSFFSYSNATNDICSDWSEIIKSFNSLRIHQDTDGFFGYYNKHATCLPKLFLTRNDSSWQFSIALTIYNFVLCLYIVCSYAIICRAKKMNQKSSRNSHIQAMQKRIAFLIGSDCACWLPICVIVFLRFSGVAISDGVYAFTAVILMPINSAVNPLIYSSSSQRLYAATVGFLRRIQKSFRFRKKFKNGASINTDQSVFNDQSNVALCNMSPGGSDSIACTSCTAATLLKSETRL